MSLAQPYQRVLDASAVLAYLFVETGWEIVEPLLVHAGISAVNWSEVVQKATARGVNIAGLASDLSALGTSIVDFTLDDAEEAASLWHQTRSLGLSLGDRACLALGIRLQLPIVTADRAWSTLSLPVSIQVVR